jgi:hypothetical protein
MGLQQAQINREVLDGLIGIAEHDQRPQLAELIRQHRDSTTKRLEEFAEAR